MLKALIEPDSQSEGGGMGYPFTICKTDVKEPAPSGRSLLGSSLKGDRGVAREGVRLDCM